MQASIYIKGLEEMERRANHLIKTVNGSRTKLLLSQARLVKKRIRARAPKGETGRLKRAAYAKAIPPSLNGPAVAFAGIRPKRAPHAHLVEFGHGGPHPAPPHPFVRPAWDGCREEVKRNISSDLKKTVEGAV